MKCFKSWVWATKCAFLHPFQAMNRQDTNFQNFRTMKFDRNRWFCPEKTFGWTFEYFYTFEFSSKINLPLAITKTSMNTSIEGNNKIPYWQGPTNTEQQFSKSEKQHKQQKTPNGSLNASNSANSYTEHIFYLNKQSEYQTLRPYSLTSKPLVEL